jgi:hypothetical protein
MNGSHEATDCRVPWEKIKEKQNQKEDRDKTSEPVEGKALAHYVVSHCNIGVIEDLFNASLSFWEDAWLLDTGATSHMTFRRDFFEDFNDNVDGVVYFADISSLKPSRMGTIKLKLPGLSDFLLDNELYLHELQRNLLSLVHIRQQGHFVHMFGGKVEIRKDSDNVVVMAGMEYGRLLKLNGTSTHTQMVAYLSHYDSGIMPSSLLWHARFGHINYVSIRLLRKNGVYHLPTIPRKLKQRDACILGKQSKQPFHDSTSRACRKLELIHSNLCGPMHVPSANGNKYIVTSIDDYTRMCWVYLLKYKSQAFETFKNFHVWIQNEAQSRIGESEVHLIGVLKYHQGISVFTMRETRNSSFLER